MRAAHAGEMLAPGKPTDEIQIIDGRELAAFALDALERRMMGIFNLVSPPGLFTMGDVVSERVRAAKALAKPNPPPHAVWAPADFLEAQKIRVRAQDGTTSEKQYASVRERRAVLDELLDSHRMQGDFVFGDGKNFTVTDKYGVVMLTVRLTRGPCSHSESALALTAGCTTLSPAADRTRVTLIKGKP